MRLGDSLGAAKLAIAVGRGPPEKGTSALTSRENGRVASGLLRNDLVSDHGCKDRLRDIQALSSNKRRVEGRPQSVRPGPSESIPSSNEAGGCRLWSAGVRTVGSQIGSYPRRSGASP
jgi:hypothetical protein